VYYGKLGECFFHYTGSDTAFEHILRHRTLQLSPYSTMRDPLEAQDWHVAGAGFSAEPGDVDRQFFEQQSLLRRAKAQSKLLSLSVDYADGLPDDPFGRGYALASMWELYAQRHAGVCLVFDRERLIKHLTEALARVGTAFHGPVRYCRSGIMDRPGASTLMLSGDDSPDDAVARHIAAHRDALFFTKLLDWEHESEYRFVLVSDVAGPVRCGYGDALRAVIVGHAFPSWQIPSALTLCGEAKVDARKLVWEMNRPLVISLKRDDARAGMERLASGARLRDLARRRTPLPLFRDSNSPTSLPWRERAAICPYPR